MRKFFLVVEVKRSTQGQARVVERCAKGKCVTCDGTTDDANPAGPSGQQCERCRSKLRRRFEKMTAKQKAAAIRLLIRSGFLLTRGEKNKIGKNDPVEKILEEASKL